jgi:hypothetical protein
LLGFWVSVQIIVAGVAYCIGHSEIINTFENISQSQYNISSPSPQTQLQPYIPVVSYSSGYSIGQCWESY